MLAGFQKPTVDAISDGHTTPSDNASETDLLLSPQGSSKFSSQHSHSHKQRRLALSAMALTENGEDDLIFSKKFLTIPKSPEVRATLKAALKMQYLFSSISNKNMELALDLMFMVNVEKDDYLIRQGDAGDNFYAVERGTFDVLISQGEGVPPLVVAKVKAGGCVGELALLYDATRAASVKACTDAVAWGISRPIFNHVINTDYRGSATMQLLRAVPLFRYMKDEDFEEMAEVAKQITFNQGQYITRQGEKGDDVYVVSEGEVMVYVDGVPMRALKPGEHFGEGALLSEQQVRTADCVAHSETCTILRLGMLQVKQSLGSGILDQVGDSLKMEALLKIPCVKNADKRDIEGLFPQFVEKVYTQGECLVQQGTQATELLVIKSGQAKVLRVDPTTYQINMLCVLQSRESIGVPALQSGLPHQASVYVESERMECYSVTADLFSKLQQTMEEKHLASMLQSVPMMSSLQRHERLAMARIMQVRDFKQGDCIMMQGQQSLEFAIVQAGEALVVRQDSPNMPFRVINRVTKGYFYGDRSLLGDKQAVHENSLMAGSDVKLLVLSDITLRLQLPNLMARAPFTPPFPASPSTRPPSTARTHPLQSSTALRVSAWPRGACAKTARDGAAGRTAATSCLLFPVHQLGLRQKAKLKVIANDIACLSNGKLDLADLEIYSTLGMGQFGRVKLVRHSRNCQAYALKCLVKRMIAESGQEKHLRSEKMVLDKINHPFCIKLMATCTDKKMVYMLLELCLGGELFKVLGDSDNGQLPEATAVFYAACVVLTLEYLHSKGICYRDLKPENLMLDSEGYIKVTDFGFAKVLEGNKTYTLCGTADYLAPEIIMCKGHGTEVDLWALGVLIYEILCGFAPFTPPFGNDTGATYKAILSGQFTIPSEISADGRDVIRRLLVKDPTARLGAGRKGWVELKSHRWFRGIDWDLLLWRRVQAPYVPTIKNALDTGNFDRYDENDEVDEWQLTENVLDDVF
ncbi:hypothetical protein CYMTET_49339 [Cymbomonas tetramitiformis]|uniref:cGMP-dependent protein kinase n=1 Tax=Cymbomonas tetramitiformis TaxID=36881 RepID=A0AAE0BRM2_9CHLO|nr:hypothetical protein CYMTET_49339 [Cymbomonas tetramitiformis]